MHLGLSLSELISLVAILGGLVTVYVSLVSRIREVEVRMEQIELLREEKDKKDEQERIENRDDHKQIMTKIDQLIQLVHEKK